MNGDFLIGTWLVQPKLNTISSRGHTVRLKVMEVLVCLASRAGEPASKQEILNRVWANTFVTEDVLARSISALRRAFDDNPRQPKFIETIPKRGYRLVASVAPGNSCVQEASLVKKLLNRKFFSATAAVAIVCVLSLLIFAGKSGTSSPVRVVTASTLPVSGETAIHDTLTQVGKERSVRAPKAVKKAPAKGLYVPSVSPTQPVTAVNVLYNTNISQNVDASVQAGEKVPPRTASLFQNIPPDVVRTRVKHAVLPTYPASAIQAHITGTVELGIAVSPKGDVSSARVLIGHPLLIQPALDAIRQWSFEPNQVQGQLTWSRMRAMVRFLPDGTTAVAFAPPLLADNFGDLGSQRDERRDAAIAPVIPVAR